MGVFSGAIPSYDEIERNPNWESSQPDTMPCRTYAAAGRKATCHTVPAVISRHAHLCDDRYSKGYPADFVCAVFLLQSLCRCGVQYVLAPVLERSSTECHPSRCGTRMGIA